MPGPTALLITHWFGSSGVITLMQFLRPAGLSLSRFRQLWYAPVLALAMGLMLMRLLIMARMLDVTSFAAYSAALLVSSSFLMLGCLGLQTLLQRELPMLIVRHREYAGGVLLVQSALVATGCSAVGAAAVLLTQFSLAGLTPSLLVIALIHGLSLQLFLVATVDSRSRGQTLRYANQNLFRALLLLPSGGAIVAFGGGVTAVLVTEAVSSLLLASWLLTKQLHAIPMRLPAATRLALRRLPFVAWRSALALLAVSFFSFLVINADRWLAAQNLQVAEFAQYSFAWTLLMVAQSVQVVINASLFPLLARCFASQGGRTAYSTAVRVSLGLLTLSALMALPLWVILDYFISRWFVAYEEARSLLPVFLIVAVLRVSDFWSSYVLVVGREGRLLVLNFISASVAAVLWMLSVRFQANSLNINQVALLALLLAAISYAVSAWAAWHCSKAFGKQSI